MKLSKELEGKRDRLRECWWFLNGGMLHHLWKRKKYTKILELANKLPISAYNEGFNAACELILGEVESDLDWIISCVEIPGEMDSIDMKIEMKKRARELKAKLFGEEEK